jgi:hypothetical protein
MNACLLNACLTAAWLAIAAAPAERSKPRPAGASAKASADLRIVVQRYHPIKPRLQPTPVRGRRALRRLRWRIRRLPITLLSRPRGPGIAQLRVGTLIRVLERRKDHAKVETLGLIRIQGSLPRTAVGYRIQKTSSLFARPGGPAIGRVVVGMLANVEKCSGAYCRVQLMGYLPIRCYIKRTSLGVKPRGTSRLRVRARRGRRLVLKAGPLYASKAGRMIAQVTRPGRVYRITRSGRWSQIRMYDAARIDLVAWVESSRLHRGRAPYYGPGYGRYNCRTGTSGTHVALSRFNAYAARDDAFPSIDISPKARFNVRKGRNGWVRIHGQSCAVFTAHALDRPGDFIRYNVIRR